MRKYDKKSQIIQEIMVDRMIKDEVQEVVQ